MKDEGWGSSAPFAVRKGERLSVKATMVKAGARASSISRYVPMLVGRGIYRW